MSRRRVPLSMELKMCKCGRLKAGNGHWRMIRTPVFDFVRQVTGEHIRGLHIRYEVCDTCHPR